MTVHRLTLLWLARDLSDLARAKWERAVARRPEEMSRIALHADPHELRNVWGWSAEATAALEAWRLERAIDAAEKKADDDDAAAMQLDKPQGPNPLTK